MKNETRTLAAALLLAYGGVNSGCGSEESSGTQVAPLDTAGTGGAMSSATSAGTQPSASAGSPPSGPAATSSGAGGGGVTTAPADPRGGAPATSSSSTSSSGGGGAGPSAGGETASSTGGSSGGAAGDSTGATSATDEGTGGSGAAPTTGDTNDTEPTSAEASRSPGCGNPTEIQSGRSTIDVEGTTREYIIALPDGYDPERAHRLVFAWHPLGGSAQQVAGMGSGGYYGLQGEDDGSAIFVAPEGLPFNGNNLGWGNDGGRDIAFLDAMYEHFREQLCIDEAQVFSTGFSFGGMMSFAVGCARGDIFRAIAPMAGNIAVSGCQDGEQPVAVMGFHGDDDSVVAISGGRDGRDVFVERNGCSQQSEPVEPSWCDELGQQQEPCSCVSYTGCEAGYPVIWCEFNGPHTPAPNSAATIWDFFTQFSDE